MTFKTCIGAALLMISTIASSATVFLTQSVSQLPVQLTSVACFTAGFTRGVSYWRAFDLAPLGLTGPLSVNMVEFGVETALAGPGATSQPVTVNVHTSAGAFPGGVLTLRASQLVNVSNQSLTKVQVPLALPTVPLPVNSVVVLELAVPDGLPSGSAFILGSNSGGQTGPSYLSSALCGHAVPTNVATFGFPTTNMILNATGTTPNTLPENLACAANAINALPPASLAPAAAKSKTTMLDLVNTATTYQASRYWSLSLAAVRSALVRTDGCKLRGAPDTTGDADLVTSCTAQAPIYACLKDAEAQLLNPPPGK